MDNVFLSALILVLEIISVHNADLLHSASGKEGGGNFTYYSMMYPGFISLELISITGDCDLYVSQHLAKPTFEPESYCLQSATCGLDTVVIPKSFKRPVGIGIYGHPSYEISSYLLNVYEINELIENDEFTDELSLLTANEPEESAPQARTITQPKKDGAEQESFIWVVFLSIIEFLIELLFL